MLLQGLTLTIVGMSVVFVFLTLLVFAMKLLSSTIQKYFPEGAASNGKASAKSISEPLKQEAAPVSDNAEIAAAVAAVSAFIKN